MVKIEKSSKDRSASRVKDETTKANDDLKQLHVNIPSKLHRKFRIKVLEEGRSMNQVIEDLIESYIDE